MFIRQSRPPVIDEDVTLTEAQRERIALLRQARDLAGGGAHVVDLVCVAEYLRSGEITVFDSDDVDRPGFLTVSENRKPSS